MFRESGFRLNKWHSNVTTLEQKELVNGTDPTFAKQQLDRKLKEGKRLGLSWEKEKDFLAMEILLEIKKSTKQTILQKLASTYYHFYITAPVAII